MSWNAGNAGTIPGSSSLKQCDWLALATKAKVARELGVRVNQLRQWRLDFEEEERNGVPKQELATAEQDLGTLRRENARLREENEILKKAAIYFAKTSR